MDLARLKHFYTVAKTGSLSGAGKILNMDHSTLSRSIDLFEHSLKTKLFERHSRGVVLTPQGQRIFQYASKLMAEHEMFLKVFHEKTDEMEGEIKIVTTPALGSVLMSNYLKGFIQLYPNVNLQIISDINNVNLNEGDVTIRSYIPHYPDLIQLRLKSFPMNLYASKEYIGAHSAPQTSEDLDNHKIISFGDSRFSVYSSTDWILKVGLKEGHIRKSYLKINSAEGLLLAAEQGLGIVELSEAYVNLRKTNLVKILPELKGPIIDIYYIYPERMKQSKKIVTLGNYLKSKLNS